MLWWPAVTVATRPSGRSSRPTTRYQVSMVRQSPGRRERYARLGPAAHAEPVDHQQGAVELAVAVHRGHVQPVEVGAAEGDVGGVGHGHGHRPVEAGGGEPDELAAAEQ